MMRIAVVSVSMLRIMTVMLADDGCPLLFGDEDNDEDADDDADADVNDDANAHDVVYFQQLFLLLLLCS